MVEEQLKEIKAGLAELVDKVNQHLVLCEKRLVPLETKVRLICWIAAVVFTVGIGAVLKACA